MTGETPEVRSDKTKRKEERRKRRNIMEHHGIEN